MEGGLGSRIGQTEKEAKQESSKGGPTVPRGRCATAPAVGGIANLNSGLLGTAKIIGDKREGGLSSGCRLEREVQKSRFWRVLRQGGVAHLELELWGATDGLSDLLGLFQGLLRNWRWRAILVRTPTLALGDLESC